MNHNKLVSREALISGASLLLRAGLTALLALLISTNTAHAAAVEKPSRAVEALERIERLLEKQNKQVSEDRDELEAQERCYDNCERQYGEWVTSGNPGRVECNKKCNRMPHPPNANGC